MRNRIKQALLELNRLIKVWDEKIIPKNTLIHSFKEEDLGVSIERLEGVFIVPWTIEGQRTKERKIRKEIRKDLIEWESRFKDIRVLYLL